MRKLLFNYSFYSHPEIGNFRVWQQRCYVRDSNKEKRSKKLRSILGVLLFSILRIWRLWAGTKNEYTIDDFSITIIREPWLLE
jgi:hypothetical protein